MTQWRFRPGLASTVMVILLFPVLVSLGRWQLDRGEQKKMLAAQFESNRQAAVWPLTSAVQLDRQDQPGRAVVISGSFEPRSILLDNRTRDGKPGYEVLTPFRLRDGSRVLVARGFIATADRVKAPEIATPTGELTLQGRLGKAPVSGVRLNRSEEVEMISATLRRVQRLDRDILNRALGHRVPDDVIYLDPAAPNGYDRRWPEFTTDVGRHQAYAVQWFAMAGVLLLLYVKINLRRPSAPSP